MVGVLAAAWHFAERLNAPLLLIHGGAPDAQKEAAFRDAMFQLEMRARPASSGTKANPPRPSRPRWKKKASIF